MKAVQTYVSLRQVRVFPLYLTVDHGGVLQDGPRPCGVGVGVHRSLPVNFCLNGRGGVRVASFHHNDHSGHRGVVRSVVCVGDEDGKGISRGVRRVERTRLSE